MSRISQSTSVSPRRVGGRGRRLLFVGGVTALVAVVSVTLSTAAFANSADPQTNPVPVGSIVVNSSGSATVSVSGTWVWPFTSLGATTTRPCDHRIGVGWALVWNDPSDAGTSISSHGVTLGVGSTGVNPANTDSKVTYNTTDPCGTFTETDTPNQGDGNVSGTWTGTHVYANVTSVPADLCIVTYDLGPGTVPAAARLKLTYDDNSLVHSFDNGGTWDASAGGSNCVATKTFKTTGLVKATPTLSTHATGAITGSSIGDTATLSATSGGHGTGTITFDAYAPTDTQCTSAVFTKQVPITGDGTYGPVSFVPGNGAGSYRWTASYGGDSTDNPVSEACGAALETSVVTAPATTPATSPPVVAPTKPAPIPGVTTVHTGEPWAGDSGIVVGTILVGLGVMALGIVRRRRRRLV